MLDGNQATGFDSVTNFWTDMMGRMAAGGAAPPSGGTDAMKQMRKAFFGAMSEYSEEYMRSEQFLQAMKKGMDNSLAMRKQVNEFLTRNVQGAQMASSSDTDNIVLLMRGMEERIMGKLDDLADRVQRLETSQNGASKSSPKASKTKRSGK